MKKGYVILLSLVLLFSIIFLIKLNVVKAQDEVPGLPITSGQMDQMENLSNSLPSKWVYLQAEWKNILLKNKVMVAIDNFMKKDISNTIFWIIFGINWNVGILPTILGVVILWLIVFVGIANLIKAFNKIPTRNQELAGFLSYILALLIAIGIARLNFYYNVVTWLGRIIFKEPNPWMRFLYFLLVMAILVIIVAISDAIAKSSQENKEKAKEQEKEHKIEKADKYIRGVKEGRNLID